MDMEEYPNEVYKGQKKTRQREKERDGQTKARS